MRILHTADIHLGQIIYQNYERRDEHDHFFKQLKKWCLQYQPDALVVSGDLFDIQQPSAATKACFNQYFAEIHRSCPSMKIIMTAGNHDSASRIQADHVIWDMAQTVLIGTSPAYDAQEGWEQKYIIKLPAGYVVALPYMAGDRQEQWQHLLHCVETDNIAHLPVVMMAHTAVAGLDLKGHDFEIGTLKTLSIDQLGEGYDYLALGHIHKPQTIGHQEDAMTEEVTYPAPVVRYSGSALHVSCDESYPHTVSLVDIDKHGGLVHIKQLRIDQLRHFYILPEDQDCYTDAEAAIADIKQWAETHQSGYIRLKMDYQVALPSNFNQMVYDVIDAYHDEIRYNPKLIWIGKPTAQEGDSNRPKIEIAELQQMKDPMHFIAQTIDNYPGLDLEELREAFEEVKLEMKRKDEN